MSPTAPTQPSPSVIEFPGFWQVPPGMLIEIGDSYLDPSGQPHACPLERIGVPVVSGLVVLRVERRLHPR